MPTPLPVLLQSLGGSPGGIVMPQGDAPPVYFPFDKPGEATVPPSPPSQTAAPQVLEDAERPPEGPPWGPVAAVAALAAGAALAYKYRRHLR